MKTEMKSKERYQPPMVEMIPMETEGYCITGSLGGNAPGDFEGAGILNSGTTSSGTHIYNSAGSSDLEDMINDILTIEQ